MVKAKRGALVFKVVLCVFLALFLGLGITADLCYNSFNYL